MAVPHHATGWRAVRTLDTLMAVLFGFAAVVQFNDPDALWWVAIYGVACLLCVFTAARGSVPAFAPFVVVIGSLVWALSIISAGPVMSDFGHMFDAWEMTSIRVEEAREASGLLLVAGWMAALGIRALRANRARAGRVAC